VVSREGIASGRAQNQDLYRPALTHALWVNIKAAGIRMFIFEKKNQKTFSHLMPSPMVTSTITAATRAKG
jgi:hypothetical protein